MRFGLPRDSNGDSDSDMPRRRSNFPKTPTVEVNVKAMDSTVLATLEDIRGKVDLLVQAQGLIQAQEASSSTFAKNDLERERMKHQATLTKLSDTELKLTDLHQELTAVREDFEEYKASTNAKLEEIMAQLASGARAQALPEAEESDEKDLSSGSDVTFNYVHDDFDNMSLEEDEEVSAPATKPKALPAKQNKFSALLTQALDTSGSSIKAKSPSGLPTKPKDPADRPNSFYALVNQAKEISTPTTESDSGSLDEFDIVSEAGESSGLADGLKAFSGPYDRATKAEAFGKLLFQAELELGLLGLSDELENPAQDPSAQPNGPSGLTAKPKDPVARSTRFSALLTKFEEPTNPATEPKAPSGSAPPPQDPLTQKIADLEAALHSKTSQISKMEQEHEETVRLMSEQLDNVYERLNPDSQTALDPQEVRDMKYEALEERNQELQSIIQANIQANIQEAELQNQRIRELEASVRNLKNEKPVVFRSEKLIADRAGADWISQWSLPPPTDQVQRLRREVDDLVMQREDLRKLLVAAEAGQTHEDLLRKVRELTEEKNILKHLLQTEIDARKGHEKEAARLQEMMDAQIEYCGVAAEK